MRATLTLEDDDAALPKERLTIYEMLRRPRLPVRRAAIRFIAAKRNASIYK